MPRMIWIAATLAFSPSPETRSAASHRVERVQVFARVVRGAEASRQGTASHNPGRVRRIIEKLPDGRAVELIVLDFD